MESGSNELEDRHNDQLLHYWLKFDWCSTHKQLFIKVASALASALNIWYEYLRNNLLVVKRQATALVPELEVIQL